MKKKKKNLLTLIALCILTIIPTVTAFASLKSGTLGLKTNTLESDGSKTYEITANLDGGKFNTGTIPEFTQKDTNNWVHNYKPVETNTKIPEPIKNGFEFTGWNINGDSKIVKDYAIPKWNNKNITLKANWKSLNATLLDGNRFNETILNMPGFENVTEIQFVKEKPNDNGTDVAKENIIKAHIEGNILKIASEGNIYTSFDAESMFQSFKNVTKITFDNFD